MTILENIKSRLTQCKGRFAQLIGKERIERINEWITYYPDHIRERMPVWTHRFIDPIKPYLQNPKYVWRFSGTVILLLLTFIVYRGLHEGKQHQFKEVPVVEYDEIEAPEGGFNPEYVRSVTVHKEKVDDQLLISGRLDFNGNDIHKIAARVQGRVEQIYIREGYPAKKGQPVLTVYSPDFLAAEQEYLLANHAMSAVAGIKDSGIASDAKDLADAARNKLMILGMDETEISKLRRSGTPLPLLAVKAPIDGMIINHTLKPGSFINLGDELTTVVGLDTIWFRGNVYEQNIEDVKIGQPLMIRSDAYPNMEFTGVIDFIAPSLDPSLHTLEARATLKNKNDLLKPGIFVNSIVTTGTEERVVIPREALIKEGNNAYVIQVLPGNHYKLRNLTVAPHSESDTVSVVRGLKDGDEIVTTGAVLVYESIKRKIR